MEVGVVDGLGVGATVAATWVLNDTCVVYVSAWVGGCVGVFVRARVYRARKGGREHTGLKADARVTAGAARVSIGRRIVITFRIKITSQPASRAKGRL